ncbi:hypothetical protein NX059_009115 [Plenodomus lindquistii]|nr:hypothetical protein NX059_009115 [Plenodomus lindquistii]
MHTTLPTYVLLSALLSQTATAFYPYTPTDSPPSSKSRRIPSPNAPRTIDGARSLTLPLHRISTRQNAYNIVNSNDPKQDNSVAIDQDGEDLSYMVAVTFGDSKEEYHLLLDSAASNTWVMGQECASAACSTHTTFGKGDSSSLSTDQTPFNITYGTGSVSGTLASDTLHIGSLSPTLTFGLATTVSQEFRSYPMDGILGIGRGTTTRPTSSISIMDALTSSNLIGSKLYGIHLSRSADGLLDGELNLGAVNEARFTGDLTYMDVVDNDTGFWEIPLQGASLDGSDIPLQQGEITAIIDTGTSYILVPPADARALHDGIQGSKEVGETYYIPCDTSAALSFTFNNVSFNISMEDWRGEEVDGQGEGMCRSNVIGRQTFGEAQWLVGDVFLKNVYSVFDFEGGRVGFGVKREGEESASATATAAARPSGTATAAAESTASASGPAAEGGEAVASGESQGQSGAAVATTTSFSSFLLLVLLPFSALFSLCI